MRTHKAKKHHSSENIIQLDEQRSMPSRMKKTEVKMIPRNIAQENYVINLEDDNKKIVFAIGPAGTGKSLLATMLAIKELKAGNIERIIITRPAVGTDGEKHGFLPGSIEQKLEPWLMPLLDVFAEYYRQDEIKHMMEEKIIEIAPIAYIRGRSFKNAIIIADEFQNTTEGQAKCILTRISEGSRLIVTGDLNQSDFSKKNGLLDIINRLKNYKGDKIAVCEFTKAHVERSEIVAEVLELYGEE